MKPHGLGLSGTGRVAVIAAAVATLTPPTLATAAQAAILTRRLYRPNAAQPDPQFSPPPPQPHESPATLYAIKHQGWVLLLIFWGLFFAPDFFASIPALRLNTDSDLRNYARIAQLKYGCALLLIAVLALRAPTVRRAIGLIPTPRAILSALGWAALVIPIMLAVSILLTLSLRAIAALRGEDPPPLIAHDLLQTIADNPTDASALTVIILVTIGAPFLEEVLYRGLLQSALLRLFTKPLRPETAHIDSESHPTPNPAIWPAILISSAVFAAIHLPTVPIYGLLPLFILSTLMGIAYHRTQNLAVPFIIHAAFNITNIVMVLL